MSRPLRVFLCHASQDKPAVKNLYRYLTQRGVQPWLDELDLLPGQHWETEIPQALFSSDVILVCLSKNSINKEGYVQKEIVFALDKAQEKPEGTIFVIPVKLEQCEVPRRLSMYQWVDYFRPDGKRRLLLGLSLRADTLGDEVSPVLLDITRRRKPLESDSAGREAREKAAREQAEREAAEKLAREKAEREGEGISCDRANHFADTGRYCVGDTTKVGSYLDGASVYGALDMAGNVWEWVNDWYDRNYYKTSPSSNPQGPTSGQYRVLRGSSWDYDHDRSVRSGYRGWYTPSNTDNDIGFRCALTSP